MRTIIKYIFKNCLGGYGIDSSGQNRIKSRALVNIIIDIQVVYTTANLLP
jgi:hypothetical protein